MALRDVAGNRRAPNTADLEEELLMAGLEAHYLARDIEARILAVVRAAGLNPEQRLSPEELGALETISIRADSALRSNCWSWRRFGPKIASSILELGWPAPPGCSLPRSAAASTASNYRPITAPAQYC